MVAALVLGAVVVPPSQARGDGAFPDAQAVLLPSDAPHRILVGTNFGLLLTDDDGATWRLACEQPIGTLVSLYQVGPSPPGTLYAVASEGLAVSRDGACGWSLAGGALVGARVLDAFADPSDAQHVLAIAAATFDAGQDQSALYESRDGGASFGAPLWIAPVGALLTGVEIARSTPSTIYLTGFFEDVDPRTTRAFVVRSTDGGANFTLSDVSAATGTRALRLAAVDPLDASTLYLRAVGQVDATDALALSTDGGATVQVVLPLATRMSGFLRRDSGALLVATRDGDLYTSTDAGAHFAHQAGIHFRGLGERAGTLYAAADFVVDGFGLAASRDDGASWQPVLTVPRVAGPMACVADACAAAWQLVLAQLGYASGLDAAAPVDGGMNAPRTSGCGCALASTPPALPLLGLALVLAALVLRRSRRR